MAKRGRPPKNKDLLMDSHLHILLTGEQKSLIEEAARIAQSDVASWARPIIVEAARTLIAESEAMKKRKK